MLIPLLLMSCNNDNNKEEKEVSKALLMFMPESSNLTSEFKVNIADMETAIEQMGGMSGHKLIVFFANSSTTGNLFEIKYEQGTCVHDTIKTYSDINCTSESTLTSIFKDMKSAAPALKYSMIISGHGMAWLPAGTDPTRAISQAKYHWDVEAPIKTRFFGGTTASTQIEIATLVSSLNNNGLKMDFILFDDCYMSSLEVAYELRNVTNYLIACPTEILAYGMPYQKIGKYLLNDDTDYNEVCQQFYNFYSENTNPYGTIAVTDCSQLDELAEVVKYANNSHTLDESLLPDIQPMDGYSPTIFYDFGDYIETLCGDDEVLLTQLNELINKAVPYKAHTEKFYSMKGGIMSINAYSGITTSACSTNSVSTDYVNTLWYKATH